MQRNNGEILSKVVLAPEDVATIHDETAPLGLPLDAISEGTVYEIYADRKSLYSLYNPYLNFIETDFKDLPSTISYNKCCDSRRSRLFRCRDKADQAGLISRL